MLPLELNEKVALVTGASGQPGRVIARTLARCGAEVAVHYHSNGTVAVQFCREIEALGRCAVAVQADVTRQSDVLAMRDAVGDTLGAKVESGYGRFKHQAFRRFRAA